MLGRNVGTPFHGKPNAKRNDKKLRDLEKAEVTGPAKNALGHLDDLAIVVLFSVFEAVVRGTILSQIEREDFQFQHPVVIKAIESAKDRIGEGSFFSVLEAYKETQSGLIEEVNQVRKYRNWVAHGKRNTQPPIVSPEIAYERLTRFLAIFITPPITEAWIDSLRDGGE